MAVRISQPGSIDAVRTIVILLAFGAALIFVPMWAPLVLAAWFAHMTRPLFARFQHWTGGRKRAAVALVLALVLLLVTPIALAALSLTSSALELVQQLKGSKGAMNALESLVGGGGTLPKSPAEAPQKVMDLAKQHGMQAYTTMSRLAGATARGIIAMFVFLLGAYTLLVDGELGYRWARQHAPLKPAHCDRFANAFNETGRGLLVGVVLTGALQAGIATIMYFILGVPSALVLGLLTFFASLIPSIGTGLVWGPVAIGLLVTGRTTAGIALIVVGVFVISLIDNFIRPVFARYGNLDLPSFVLLVAMFGGLAFFGGWGLVLGPLLVRLFVEGLRIAREERLTGAHTTPIPPEPAE